MTPAVAARRPSPVAYAGICLAGAFVYWIGAEVGFRAAFSVRQVSPVWPPTGIALALLLRLGRRYWPAVAAGAFAANWATGEPAWAAAGIAVGNTLEALAGALLLRRLASTDFRFGRLREVVALLAASAVGPVVAATIGVGVLAAARLLPAAATVGGTWLVWWMGDAMGALVVAPLLLAWTADRRLAGRTSMIEAVAVVGLLFAVSLLIFDAPLPAGPTAASLAYVVFPFLIWSALRLGPREVVAAVFLVSALAIMGAIRGHGPFAASGLTPRLIQLQIFMAVVTVTALALAALVSERREAADERLRLLAAERAARVELEKANLSKDELLAVLSHELRTPLTPILGWTRMLRDGLLDEPARARALEVIERNAALQSRLVEDLLDVSRIVTGRMTFDRTPLDFRIIVRPAVAVLRQTAQDRTVTVEERIAEGPVWIAGDAERLRQAVTNILQNALKFSRPHGRIDVILEVHGATAELRVHDDGRGIAPEHLSRVFLPFVQSDTGTTRSYGGLGLGLVIVRHVVEGHGGAIRAESEGPGRGTTIVTDLPLVEAPPARAEAGASPPVRLDGIGVLVVDDEPDTRDFLSQVLTQAGAELRVVGSTEEALGVLDEWTPDALVSDIGRPGRDGLDMIRAIRARAPERGGRVPSLVLTAYAGQEDGRRARGSGFDLHMAKPVKASDLVAALAGLVSGRGRC